MGDNFSYWLALEQFLMSQKTHFDLKEKKTCYYPTLMCGREVNNTISSR